MAANDQNPGREDAAGQKPGINASAREQPGTSYQPKQQPAQEDDPFPRGQVTYGPFHWKPGQQMTWAQYRANARVYGYFKFQQSLPDEERLYPTVLPLPDRLENNDLLQKVLVDAWMKHEDDKRPLRNPGRVSPPSKYQLAGTSQQTYAPSMHEKKAEWFPWVTYWPDSANPTYIVRSNRANHPPLPPRTSTPVKIRHDARNGTQEWAWIPGWAHHPEHKTYMPFIPLKEPVTPREHRIHNDDGGWYFATHTTVDGDLPWYRIDFDHMITGGGEGLFQLNSHLKETVVRTARELWHAWVKEESMIQDDLNDQWHRDSPDDRFAEMKAAMAFLLREAGPSWEVRGALVAYQRITLEVRGWLAYSAALRTAQLTKFGPRWGDSKAQKSEMHKMFSQRHSRGVFVLQDESLAMQYAGFDVPVWLCQKFSAPDPRNTIRGTPALCYAGAHFTAPLEMQLRGDPNMKAPDGYLMMAKRRAAENANREEEEKAKAFRAAVAAKAGQAAIEDFDDHFNPGDEGPQPQEDASPPQVANAALQGADISPAGSNSAAVAKKKRRKTSPGKGHARAEAQQPYPTQDYEQARRLGDESRALELNNEAGLGDKEARTEHIHDLKDPSANEPVLGTYTGKMNEGMKTRDSAQKRKELPAPTSAEPNKKKRLSVFKDAVANMDHPELHKNVPVRLTSYHEPKRNLPDWWPQQFELPLQVSKTVDTRREREIELAACKFAVPQSAKGEKPFHKMPTLAYFMNAWSDKGHANRTKERNILRCLFRWLQIRQYYLAKVALQEIGEDDGFTKDEWRKIKKCLLMDAQSYPIVKRLGLDVIRKAEARAVTEEELEAMMSTELPDMTLREILESIKGTLSFDGHMLTPPKDELDESWLSLEWERYILWDISELEFRYEMLSLAVKMRSWYPNKADLQQVPDIEYFNMVKECWSEGLDALKPRGDNWLCCRDPKKCIPALRTFAQVMRYWPRAEEMLRPWEKHWGAKSVPPALDSEEYKELESSAWYCYLQSYYDHRGRPAPLPHVRPPPPFIDDPEH